ncbi:elongation factor P hydroxylase [Glaciecola petra]|uniref:Elongation factor P hydroxylase n=1 Tax=Glaciecola petra TaxID=3075602 RepID=A0ABU2ZNV5_9ALTE|nr:elongation factor P hydroxylase [Aestuariibacter sp. P117]MDT0593951.1 elongation factor P hydroxylase [Aestuariibacter sp. P117]
MSLHGQLGLNTKRSINLVSPKAVEHNSVDLESLFASCFEEQFSTILIGGADEPLYQPNCQKHKRHVVYYRYDYFASALHEIAHWCIAGDKRRQQEDYGYWYVPDGRNARDQVKFLQVEIKPQALEYAFSKACGIPFCVSIDNLSHEACDITRKKEEQDFTNAVQKQLSLYQVKGFPTRAQSFLQVLNDYY